MSTIIKNTTLQKLKENGIIEKLPQQCGGIPPAEPINEIGSDIFKYTPQGQKHLI